MWVGVEALCGGGGASGGGGGGPPGQRRRAPENPLATFLADFLATPPAARRPLPLIAAGRSGPRARSNLKAALWRVLASSARQEVRMRPPDAGDMNASCAGPARASAAAKGTPPPPAAAVDVMASCVLARPKFSRSWLTSSRSNEAPRTQIHPQLAPCPPSRPPPRASRPRASRSARPRSPSAPSAPGARCDTCMAAHKLTRPPPAPLAAPASRRARAPRASRRRRSPSRRSSRSKRRTRGPPATCSSSS